MSSRFDRLEREEEIGRNDMGSDGREIGGDDDDNDDDGEVHPVADVAAKEH